MAPLTSLSAQYVEEIVVILALKSVYSDNFLQFYLQRYAQVIS